MRVGLGGAGTVDEFESARARLDHTRTGGATDLVDVGECGAIYSLVRGIDLICRRGKGRFEDNEERKLTESFTGTSTAGSDFGHDADDQLHALYTTRPGRDDSLDTRPRAVSLASALSGSAAEEVFKSAGLDTVTTFSGGFLERTTLVDLRALGGGGSRGLALENVVVLALAFRAGLWVSKGRGSGALGGRR